MNTVNNSIECDYTIGELTEMSIMLEIAEDVRIEDADDQYWYEQEIKELGQMSRSLGPSDMDDLPF